MLRVEGRKLQSNYSLGFLSFVVARLISKDHYRGKVTWDSHSGKTESQ